MTGVSAFGVSPVGSQRRIQALIARGWAASELARCLAMLPTHLDRMLREDQPVRPGRAAEITALYEALWNVPPDESTPAGRRSAASARRRARGRGWAPPMAWDDNPGDPCWIDDPAAGPAEGWQRRGGDRGDSAALAASAAELIEKQGYDRVLAADRLKVSRAALDKAISRTAAAAARAGSEDITNAA